MAWMREIITKKALDLGMPDVDTVGDDRKMPDIVIYDSKQKVCKRGQNRRKALTCMP